MSHAYPGTNENAQGLRLQYQILVDDIKFAKRQQWTITYYIILTFAAIVGIYALLQPNKAHIYTLIQPKNMEPVYALIESGDIHSECVAVSSFEKVCLLFPAFLISLLGIWHVTDCHRCLCEYRTRIIEIQRKLRAITDNVWVIGEEEGKKYDRFSRYFGSITLPFIMLLAFGFFSVAWIVLRRDVGLPSILTLSLLIMGVLSLGFGLLHHSRFEKFKKDPPQ